MTAPTGNTGAAKKKFVMDIHEIKKFLPHRYPMLLVDRVLELDSNRAVGVKNVSANEHFFEGHFPQRPVMPGVLIVEALAQLGGVMMLSRPEFQGKLAYLASINNARFRKPVVPGDQVMLEITITKLKSRIGICEGSAKVDGEEVCNAEMMFSLVD